MLIKEVCTKCGLTKKALEYYEKKGLITPVLLKNGYRDYQEQTIAVLKEISVLRHCGIGIAEIKTILSSPDKAAEIEKYSYLNSLKIQRLNTTVKCMERLIEDYDINREFTYLQYQEEELFTLKEKIVLAFPGNYGLFLSLHFGRFLNERIDTEEKKKAYASILEFLDNADLYFSPVLSEYLRTAFAESLKAGAIQLETQYHQHLSEVFADTEDYLERNRTIIEKYAAYRLSEEFNLSFAGEIQKQILEFQKNSGYQEHFIHNMKILSKSYAAYLEKLETLNEKFISRYPQLRQIMPE